MKEKEKNLEEFGWDNQIGEIDFFGENALEGMVVESEPKQSAKEEKKEEETIPEGGKEETEETDNFFSSIEEIEEKEIEDTPKNNPYKDIYSTLKSNGIIEEDEEEPEEITEDFISEKIEASVEKRFEESIKELPQDLKNIIKYVSNGGNLYDILGKYSEQEVINEDIDMDDEDNQERVLRVILEEEGNDKEDIDSQIEYYKDSGKLKNISSKKFEKWKEKRAEEIEEEVERQKAVKKSQIESQKEFKKSISTFVSESTEIKGMPLNKKDSQELPDYISNPTIKLQDGRQITPFYRDLFESFKDKEKLVLLAKLVKNEFDFSDIKKEVATKQTREIKNEFQRQKKNQPKEAHIPKRLVDLI